jgi:hypothetical protein
LYDFLAGVDYESLSSFPVTFSPGVTAGRVRIPIINDDIVEGNELFRVLLMSTNPGVLVTQDTATVGIIDTDGEGIIYHYGGSYLFCGWLSAIRQ